MFEFWGEHHPPTDTMIAGYLGFKPKVSDTKNAVDPNDPSGLAELFKRHFPNGVPGANETR